MLKLVWLCKTTIKVQEYEVWTKQSILLTKSGLCSESRLCINVSTATLHAVAEGYIFLCLYSLMCLTLKKGVWGNCHNFDVSGMLTVPIKSTQLCNYIFSNVLFNFEAFMCVEFNSLRSFLNLLSFTQHTFIIAYYTQS